MSAPTITAAFVWQGTDCMLLARIRSVTGPYITQSSLNTISLTVYDKNNGMVVVTGPIALAIATVIFNTLQPYDGVLWSIDKTGYNFKYRLAGLTAFPNASDYRVTIIFTLTDGTTFPVEYDLTAMAVP